MSKLENSQIKWEVVTTVGIFSGTFSLQGEPSIIRCEFGYLDGYTGAEVC